MMKLYDFLSLPDNLQFQAVWDLGIHIETVIQEKEACQLYVINDFYVEITYDIINNIIVDKLPFKGGLRLDKYLGDFPKFI